MYGECTQFFSVFILMTQNKLIFFSAFWYLIAFPEQTYLKVMKSITQVFSMEWMYKAFFNIVD